MVEYDDRLTKSRGFRIFMRIMNAITSLILVGIGVAGFILVSIKQFIALQFYLACSPLFLILFGFMLFAADFNFKIINRYFPFLKNYLGIGFFNIYLSTIIHYYFSCQNNIKDIGWISASGVFGLGIFYCIMFCINSGGQIQEIQEQPNNINIKKQQFEMIEKPNDTKRQLKDPMV